MTSPQDIREKTFEKAVFGGYEMGAVDDYMDSLAAELGAIQKENSALKAKMKVLVDKIEEYRTNESALNMAILSAQKLSVQIESDARSRAAAIVSEAEAWLSRRCGTLRVTGPERLFVRRMIEAGHRWSGSEGIRLETVSPVAMGRDADRQRRLPIHPAGRSPYPAKTGR